MKIDSINSECILPIRFKNGGGFRIRYIINNHMEQRIQIEL